MTTFSGTVISIEENMIDDDTVSIAHILDNDYNSYQVLIFKSTDNIFEDDTVRFWGVTVGPLNFPNVSGGVTNVQYFFGSHIEKS